MKKEERKKVVRTNEIPELREKNRKVFRMSDGSEQAVFFSSVVHVFDDETQTYQEVDNTLHEEEDGRHYVCGKNHFTAKFSCEEDNDELFCIEQGAHRIAVFSKKNKKNKNRGVKPSIRKKDKEGVVNADLISYPNIEAATDYEYSVDLGGVKEDIIIKEKANVYRYPFILKCENVTAEFDEQKKRIAFLSNESGKEVFFIPAPFMSDANGATSTAVSYEMKEAPNGDTHLTVIADSDWINSKKRAFPVVIDPQINVSDYTYSTSFSWEDGYLSETSLHTIGRVEATTDYAISTICESDDGCESNMPEGMSNAIEIPLDSWKNGTIASAGDEVWYKFTAAAGTGNYIIRTQGSMDTMGYLYCSNGNEITHNDDCNGLNFCIKAYLTNNETYYVKVRAFSTKTGNYSVSVCHEQSSGDSAPDTEVPSVCYTTNRMYLHIEMPTLPKNIRIKKAEVKLFQRDGQISSSESPKICLHHVEDYISLGEPCTPAFNELPVDFAVMKAGRYQDGDDISYSFDITDIVDKYVKGETEFPRFVLKMMDESVTSQDYIVLYGTPCGPSLTPQIIIDYELNYGVNTSYRTHTHELGCFGQGSVDLQCGNLMFESEDFGWAGNRMPVTIKHLYNSALSNYQYMNNSSIMLNTAEFGEMKLGNGFKLNIMQSVVKDSNGDYVYIGENGEAVYLKESDEKVCNETNDHCYPLYKPEDDGDIAYDEGRKTLKQCGQIYQFDDKGRLVSITDENHKDNKTIITYTSDRITSVTDSVGREFGFSYNASGFLTSITAPGHSFDTPVSISYGYTGNLLTSVTYQDGNKAVISYVSNKPSSVILQDSNSANVYKVAYAFNGDKLSSVTEYGVENNEFVIGNTSSYSYSAASSRTVVETVEPADASEGETSNNVIKTVYTFDDDGNIVSEYVYSEDTGNVGANGEESGINPHSGDGGAGVVSNINNLLVNHGFDGMDNWSKTGADCDNLYITFNKLENIAHFGKNSLYIKSNNKEYVENGIYQTTNVLPAGQYTFSIYAKGSIDFSGENDIGAYIRVSTLNGTVLAESEHITKYDDDYIRLVAPFELSDAHSVQVQILLNGRGSVYVDGAQLENNPYANSYNMLQNGNFERVNSGWSCSSGVSYSESTRFNMSRSLCMIGNIESERSANQKIYVKSSRTTRETFALSGWAKGYGLPNHEREDVSEVPMFRLRAEVKYKDAYYKDNSTETFTAEFSPCTEEWQFASVEFSKSKYRIVEYIRVFCDYSYNAGTAYFDDIQLVRTGIEKGLSASDFEIEPDEEPTDTAETENETNTTEVAEFKEATDDYGNTLTETTFTDGEFGTIYRAFGFTSNCNGNENVGNNLVSETDARGNVTEYIVDEETSRNDGVIDRCGNKTSYEYDKAGKTTKVISSKKKIDPETGEVVLDEQTGKPEYEQIADVSYAYDAFDNLTEIVRGDGLKYVLKYNAFHNLESIGVDNKAENLVKYTYKNGNGRLKEVAYANGDVMKAAYNSIGQMVSEKWFDKDDNKTAHYKYVYDGQGNIVRSIDIGAGKEYNYLYEDGRIMQSSESDIELDNNDFIVSKAFVVTTRYYYKDDELIKKTLRYADGTEQTVNYEKAENDSQIVKFAAGGRTVSSHSKTDSFGRKMFDELQLGTGFVTRQFTYHAGEDTKQHKDSAKLKSSPTTQLVSQIVLSDGTTLSYNYDAEERITSVTESRTIDDVAVASTTIYTYDALGQLLTETKDGQLVNSMTYDNYGNILTKNGIVYTYGDENWKDLLTGYGEQPITYDAQGNPVSYLGHTLTWEKGRQLKSFDGNTYTYNANGIRTSKTVDGILHDYVLDGAKILKETWEINDNKNVLIPLYDNEETVCGIIYNDIPYYFLKNQQGDIISITDKNGQTIASYSYDAWGVCTITQDSSNCSIATINPFRYRGYYYDTEIGMYYLQTRYYNPVIGRFINSDDVQFVVVCADPLRTNLCSYCCNETTNYEDQDGRDAVWVQASKSVAKMGHTGLVFKYRSKWYYWYWGIHPKAAIWGYLASLAWSLLYQRPSLIGTIYRVAATTVLATCKLQVVSSSKTITEKKALDLANGLYDSNTKFDESLYIKGNFDNSYYYFRALNITRNYNLLRNNCMQTTIDGLYAGKFSTNNVLNHLRLKTARAMIVPNFAYSYMHRFF